MTDKSPVKGWCPGAHRPMMSGDGLIVRIRPRLGRITKRQALGLCDISRVLGNGIIDLTSRANLQLRGIAEHDHQTVLDQLLALDVLDPTPDGEARRNITVTPTWTADDLTHRLHDAICARLGELPALPAKMGIAIDTGPHRLLHTTSADFRIERGADTPLILRADGAGTGCPITEATAIDALIALANWFVETNGAAAKRMAPHIAQTPLAKAWTPAAPSPAGAPLTPGRSSSGHILGAPFGSIEAAALAALLQDTHAPALRVTPWRLFQLEGTDAQTAHGFITDARDPLLSAHACPGAPACAAATVDTRALARRLAAQHRDLHVSGCAKGCAHPKAAALTLTGRDGAYDLVEQGHPWDQPRQRGLSADALLMTKA